VVGGDHVDIELFHNRQGFEHDGGVGQNNVVVIFLGAAQVFAVVAEVINKARGAGNVLAKDVVADQQLVFGNIGHHAVGPVQHAGFLKNDGALADVDAVAAFHGLHGPVFAVEISGHGFKAGLRHKYFFRLAALHNGFQRASVVQLHVVADDIVHFFRLKNLGHAAQQRALAACGHGVEQNVFFVLDQIGIVSRTVGGAGIAVKIPVIIIDKADPENIFFYFNWLHVVSPQKIGAFPFMKSPALP